MKELKTNLYFKFCYLLFCHHFRTIAIHFFSIVLYILNSLLFRVIFVRIKGLAKIGDLLIRMVAGIIFLVAGYLKLIKINAFSGFLASLSFPFPVFLAYVATFVELIGGFMLLIGLFTWLAGLFLAVEMGIVIVFVQLFQGWDAIKWPLLLFVICIRYIGSAGYCNLFSCTRPRRRH